MLFGLSANESVIEEVVDTAKTAFQKQNKQSNCPLLRRDYLLEFLKSDLKKKEKVKFFNVKNAGLDYFSILTKKQDKFS